jgi:hypothetical protein
VIATTNDAVELYPVEAGAVLEEGRIVAGEANLDSALAALQWITPAAPRRDWPWLTAWLSSPRGRHSFVTWPVGMEEAGLRSIVHAHLRA